MLERAVHVISWLWVRSWEKVGVWHNIDKIHDYLYLSSLPMRGNEQNLKNGAGVQEGQSMLVVSVVESYENTETLPFMDPTRPDEWKHAKTNHDQVKMKDFSGGREISIESAADTVIKIQQHRLSKQPVLVHCKAGRTRSAMLVACVLAIYEFGQMPAYKTKTTKQLIDIAVEYMETKRPQVKVHEDVKETAVKIINTVQRKLRGEAKHDESLKTRVDRLLASHSLNGVIVQMDAYKKLLAYRSNAIEETGELLSKIKPIKRVELIDKILASINEESDAKNGEWFANLMYQTGPIKDLVNAKPYFVKDKVQDHRLREALVEKLKNDVEDLICLNADCTREELEMLYFPAQHQSLLQPS